MKLVHPERIDSLLKKEEALDIKKLVSLPQIWDMNDIDKSSIEASLEGLGFEKIISTDSHYYESLKSNTYAHKLGILLTTEKNIAFTIHATIQLNLGAGLASKIANYCLNRTRIRGIIQSNGEMHSVIQFKASTHTNVSYVDDFIKLLDSIQRCGKLIPFNEWAIDNYTGSMRPENVVSIDLKKYQELSNKALSNNSLNNVLDSIEVVFNNDFGFKGLNKVIKSRVFNYLINEGKWHSDIAEIVAKRYPEEFYYLTSKPNTGEFKPDFITENEYFELLNAQLEMERVNNYSSIRYFSDKDNEIHKKWLSFFESKKGALSFDINELKDMDYDKRLSNGVSFGQLLLSEASMNDKLYDLLLKIIEIAPKEILTDWCVNADSSGKTLGMLIYDNYMEDRYGVFCVNYKFNDKCLFELLIEKIGSKNIIMNNEKWSINGLWLESFLRRGGKDYKRFNEHLSYIDYLKNLKVELSEKWTLNCPYKFRITKKGDYVFPKKVLSGDNASDIVDYLNLSESDMDSLIKELFGSNGNKLSRKTKLI